MKKEDTYTMVKGVLDAYVTANHLRHTVEREHVLRLCCQADTPFSLDTIVELAQKEFISRSTVYNTIQLLLKAKIVHSLNKQYESRCKPQYEIVYNHNNHAQLICTKCGRVSEFKPKIAENVIISRKYSNFTPHHFSLYVYGECKICRRLVGKNIK